MGREFQVKAVVATAALSDSDTVRSLIEAVNEAAEVVTEGAPFDLDTSRVELVFTGTTKEQ
jgi:hypothetical protein